MSTDSQFEAPKHCGLFAGDALTRAMMSDALFKHSDPQWYMPFLVESFADENYPIVRYFDANGLGVMNIGINKPDYLADAESRARQISSWANMVDAAKRNETKSFAEKYRKLRTDVDIEVGE